ncbi:MAG: hypothetical protein CMJ67_00400 [Planctomycetaceae bacterium]|nr:hypothetical protein [Planctomycetaceae bacterium]
MPAKPFPEPGTAPGPVRAKEPAGIQAEGHHSALAIINPCGRSSSTSKIFTVPAAIFWAAVIGHATSTSDITACPSGCDFSSIKSAIDSAGNGDVILVFAGQCDERNMDTKRSTNRQGSDPQRPMDST